MFQTTSNLSIKDNKSEVASSNNELFSLPNIPKKPASRGEPPSKKQLPQKQKLILPSLYYSQIDGQQLNMGDKDKENFQFKNKTLFARQVKERLDLVLGQMPHVDNASSDNDDSDDIDFEQKINQNKQLIKLHKLKRQNEKNSTPQRQKNSKEKKYNKPPKKSRNESLYEKRAKQYRQESIENKYLHKRKQTVREQNQNSIVDEPAVPDKEARQRDQLSQAKGGKNSAKKTNKRKGAERMLSQRSSNKNLIEPARNDTLFDCIQNYLQNPHENRKQNVSKNLVGLTLLKAKRDIEDKIKAINEKLGITQHEQKAITQRLNNQNIDSSVRDWRRIEVGSRNIDYQISNFDKQIDRISSLQQRNSMCLQKYLEQQKILVDLELRKNQLIRKNANSH